MAILEHPYTGVQLNPLVVKRRRLSFNEAVTAWVLKLQGVSYTDITHQLGTNANRIGEVLREEEHPGARMRAEDLMRKHKALLI